MSYRRENSTVEKPFCTRAEARNWRAIKCVVESERGWPDREVFKGLERAKKRFRDHCYLDASDAQIEQWLRELLALIIEFVELKSPDGETLPAHQLRRHEELRRLGFTVSVLDSKEAVEKWFADRA